MVAVSWSFFETNLHTTATAIFDDEPETRDRFEQVRSMQTRLNIVQTGVEAKMIKPHRGRFIALLKEARDCQQMRDRIIHGSWSGTGDDPINNPQSNSVFNWLKPRHPYEWKLDFGKIKAVALRIDKLCSNWLDVITADVPPADFILLNDAIKLKLKP
ncbi:hypothetical protein HFN59_06670 [Rhizobium leguminosarum]|uniref:hypothetical protein n=1 Tax=Rhizobium leguminosarum TaxID=384 RepID=UPI001C96B4C9|nr:hypothetical protein [Rhizobium leguminosarum]MBY5776797.1 hypothetical protein [Rhizobium leguminosarum]